MVIEIEKQDGPFTLVARNEDGHTLTMDASTEIGGLNQGMRPMQVLLAALAGCASMDVLSILQKKRQAVRQYAVTATGDRAEEVPKIFTHITLTWKVRGQVEEVALRRAVELSMDKYCSVTAMISPPAQIDHVFDLAD